MKVLVACEESQEVCKAFRAKGHEAYSCDIQYCSGGHPEWHICRDVLEVINGIRGMDGIYRGWFHTVDGEVHDMPVKWDLIIAHPPCTYLTVAGNRWFNVEKYGEKALERYEERAKAIIFFMKIYNADCPRVAVENPVGYMNTHFRPPDCIIYPWQYGESNNKPICLWLRGLEVLRPTKIVERAKTIKYPCGSYNSATWSGYKQSAKQRSRSFQCISKAMAEQWGNLEGDDG